MRLHHRASSPRPSPPWVGGEGEVTGSLGLILNELISNALKHAFPGGRSGTSRTIQVSFRFQSSGKLLLAVQDGGVCLPEGFDLDNTLWLGLKMIRDLNRQVGGTLNLFRNNGTGFEITLPTPVLTGSEK